MRNGYLVLGQWRGAPVRVHWSLPLGALLFGRGRLAPGFWLGFFLVVLIHEIGHARVVRRQRARVLSIDLHGLGGECSWQGDVSAMGRARIAWGGVQAQFVALVLASIAVGLFGEPRPPFVADLASAFTTANVWLIVLNLLPVPPLDGAEAWKLLPLLRQQHLRRKRRAAEVKRTSIERELALLDAGDRPPMQPAQWNFEEWMKKEGRSKKFDN
jgi:Zn-dependent protease